VDIVNNAVNALQEQGIAIEHPNSVAEDYINDGEEMAASAIAGALLDEAEAGVTACDDGYCFGRESVEDAIAAISRGELVVVVDDMARENEGDFIMAADLCTPETMATIVRYSSGVICIGMEGERMDELKLPAMVANSEDPKETAFSVSVDASSANGITTGISSKERALTMKLLATPSSTAVDFVRPGHIFPLRAKKNGVLTRDGHTEAAVDLSRLAGRHPSGVLCEIVSEENPTEMARLPELKRFCKKHGFVLTSIVDLAQYRRDTEDPVSWHQ
jgi:3,4-dihydroxy 2-butanone 4-phosphate synthase/GTP cyclohydrolase II